MGVNLTFDFDSHLKFGNPASKSVTQTLLLFKLGRSPYIDFYQFLWSIREIDRLGPGTNTNHKSKGEA